MEEMMMEGEWAGVIEIMRDFALNPVLVKRLVERANERKVDMKDVVIDIVVTGLRVEVERNYPTFTVPLGSENGFLSDGFRVVERVKDRTTMCPFNGVPFEEAASFLLETGFAAMSEQEVLEVVRS